ncbi:MULTISPECIES: aldehyde dehydrogenase [Mycolicibacterium]|jgi:aldehyde dehydrogenase (NAD+)|uniref:Aldehyde dehydrogenase n=2 Tax=Mycolicibacterium TaxID=1866885 RepID=A0ABT8HBT2_MYCAO|nr:MULTISPECIES: aldehyde dehydrogenase [Mycolicibacterium]MDN4518000.1 aldehyde dehydrogenase [Mycolicibacterium austroafricanum]MDW5612169.1 aldehyde dehydrogenase [Mycolicibacterium sp. D5.8-2]PQP49601.1 aldehyde dehydrogenase [Mycolicibacterium austroafricanum]QRZ06235.1 aldehyde dehydrogenase [Mycolicibacterium austroafricanum]QZT67711.1 aldehyde dehydrogenase [Mycolicibacterium austroafricanum]
MAILADRESRLLIDGKLVAGSSGTFTTVNPATEETLGVAADASAEDMSAAIGAARRSFDETDWATNTDLRVRCIRQLQQAMRDHVEELRELTIAEVGAPRMLTSAAQLEGPVEDLSFCADTAESYAWTTDLGIASPMGIKTHRTIAREAVGVVGAITPWNFPHQINLAKIGPALAAGNTLVLKPAPDTPWAAAVLGELIAEHTDFPAGVINIVTSSDHGVGALLSKDPRVDMVSFTGSTNTGRAVMADGAATLKKVFLELGGKSAFLVLDDADLAGACSMAAFTASMHAGQGCAITTRLVVPRDRYDEAVEAAAATMGGLKAGDPTKPGTVCGPLISERQRERVQGYLDSAIAEGGRFACGGGRPADRDTGFFIDPTVIAGLDNNAKVAREEIFGPVLTVIAHDGDDDAVRIANDSPYGLSGTVFSADPERAAGIAARMRVGTVNVNGGVWYSADMPFGGYKQSGIGREMGLAGFEEYLEIKAIATAAN